MKACVVGNCQVAHFAICLKAALPDWEVMTARAKTSEVSLSDFDYVFAQTPAAPLSGANIITFPNVVFGGFHPDVTYIYEEGTRAPFRSALWNYHSILVSAAFLLDLPRRRTTRLFNGYIYDRLGYLDHFERQSSAFLEWTLEHGHDLTGAIEEWSKDGVFMDTPNHPQIRVSAWLVRQTLRKAGIKAIGNPEDVLTPFTGVVWPVYPEMAERIMVPGSLSFRRDDRHIAIGRASHLNLEEFITASYRHLAKIPRERIEASPRIAKAIGALRNEVH
jgi:hypothetical protein